MPPQCIHVGESYQAFVPEYDAERSSPVTRADELLFINHTPLSEPPRQLPFPTLLEETIQAAASSVKASRTANQSQNDDESDDSSDDFDANGAPLLPEGVTQGDFCIAEVMQAGELRQYKAVLVSVSRHAD